MREYVRERQLGLCTANRYSKRVDTQWGQPILSLQLALAQLGEARGVEEELAALRHLLQDELKGPIDNLNSCHFLRYATDFQPLFGAKFKNSNPTC